MQQKVCLLIFDLSCLVHTVCCPFSCVLADAGVHSGDAVTAGTDNQEPESFKTDNTEAQSEAHPQQAEEARQLITDPWAFKRSLEMWPSPM